jgi:hypothetical protein
MDRGAHDRPCQRDGTSSHERPPRVEISCWSIPKGAHVGEISFRKQDDLGQPPGGGDAAQSDSIVVQEIGDIQHGPTPIIMPSKWVRGNEFPRIIFGLFCHFDEFGEGHFRLHQGMTGLRCGIDPDVDECSSRSEEEVIGNKAPMGEDEIPNLSCEGLGLVVTERSCVERGLNQGRLCLFLRPFGTWWLLVDADTSDQGFALGFVGESDGFDGKGDAGNHWGGAVNFLPPGKRSLARKC